MPTKPIELHYWPTPNGWKITIMLEELGVPYDVKYVNIGKGEQFEPSFLKIAPNNRMPAIVDPEGPGGEPISVFESGAILQYLGRKFGKFYPADERERVEVDQWLFWQMGGLGPMAGQAHHFRQYAPEKSPMRSIATPTSATGSTACMNKRLADRDFLAGDYSIADMACIGWVRPYKNQGQDLEDFPNLKRWFETMLARPAVERGIEVGRGVPPQPRRRQGSAEGAVRPAGAGVEVAMMEEVNGDTVIASAMAAPRQLIPDSHSPFTDLTASSRSGSRRSGRRARSPSCLS